MHQSTPKRAASLPCQWSDVTGARSCGFATRASASRLLRCHIFLISSRSAIRRRRAPDRVSVSASRWYARLWSCMAALSRREATVSDEAARSRGGCHTGAERFDDATVDGEIAHDAQYGLLLRPCDQIWCKFLSS